MKILLINKYHYLRGGAERAYFDTAAALAARGHEIAFFSMKHPRNIPTPWEKYFVSTVEYADDGKMGFGKKLRSARNILWNVEAAKNLDRLIDEFRPDVAHLHNIYHQLSPSILRTLKRRGIPMVMTLHDYKLISPNYSLFVRGSIWNHASGWRCVADRCVKDSFLKSAVCAAEQCFHQTVGVYRNINTYIAPSEFLISKFREHGFSRQIQCIKQPVEPFPKIAAPIPAADAPILFFGRLSPEKGVDILIRAVAQLESLHLRIVGEGPDEERLKSLVRELGAEHRIEFLGYRSGGVLWKEVNSALAVVFPSVWYENMPYVLLESMARGKIVVASKIGGMPEVVRDGETGLLFEAGNVDALSNVLATISARSSELISLGEMARKEVERLSLERYGDELESLYQNLL